MAHPAIKPGFSLSVGSSVGLVPSSQWPRYLLQNLYRSGMVLIVNQFTSQKQTDQHFFKLFLGRRKKTASVGG